MVVSTIGQLLLKHKSAKKTTTILTFRLRIEKFISVLVPFNGLKYVFRTDS